MDILAGRTKWVDVARGIGIILVVWGHVLRANVDFTESPWAAQQDRWIYSFHMPLFFFVAGLFLWRSIGRSKRQFLVSRWWAIVWPYLLWSTISGLLETAASRYVNTPLRPEAVISTPLVPIEQYWFLYALLVCQLAALIAYPSKLLLCLLAAAGLGVALTFGTPWIGLRAFLYLPFVIVGVLLAGKLDDLTPVTAAAIAVAGAGLLAAALSLGSSAYPVFFVCGVAGSLAVAGVSQLAGAAVLAGLGRASLAIFVLHTIFSAGTRIALKFLGISPSAPLSVALCFAFGLLIPWAIYRAAQQAGCLKRLGLGEQSLTAAVTARRPDISPTPQLAARASADR